MTTKETTSGENLARLNANLERIEDLSQRLVAAFSKKKPIHPGLEGPGHDLYMKAATAYMSNMMTDPAKLLENQVGYWGKAVQNYIEIQNSLLQGEEIEDSEAPSTDRRFSDPLWNTHPFFHYVKNQYLASSSAIAEAVENLEGMEDTDKKRLKYFSQQVIDMMSPTNFLGTNPTALTKAVETDGQSVVDGLENLVRDLEANDGDLLVTLSDKDAFKLGENIATTEGSVVFRNEIFELIQYAPKTEKVKATPLIIFPPWINKFYILDLKEKNSLIRWIIDQGYTLFVVSWKNPDASYSDFSLDDYIEKGYLTAIEQVKSITKEEQVNAIGYCIAGTTLALTLALLNKRGDNSVKSATFFTTMTDFEDQGEMTVFLSDDFVDAIEAEIAEEGILDKMIMSRTFSFLRSNDLIYAPAIKSYMMGEAPPAFDLLYWNGDGTNLPGRMAVQYLRGLCQGNQFANEGIELLGETLRLEDVKTPLYSISCETDHIAAWDACYSGVQKMGSKSKTFVMSESGHIAGIVNPPSKKKYGHYTNPELNLSAAEWRESADFNEGSWWPAWEKWLKTRSGKQKPARVPGSEKKHPVLDPAPGKYVSEKPKVH
ncbi:MAG: class I poly(R)-hydroxyalkanoic acid synthase [Boseongicola sp.]|nr:class I poly(R)-hydroxyalkanoic acid synthase [Boseongicola sp.]MDD9977647.1 class I poly(R)-hydroxyalkanoic acid synthase [Boseongicola sp.]